MFLITRSDRATSVLISLIYMGELLCTKSLNTSIAKKVKLSTQNHTTLKHKSKLF